MKLTQTEIEIINRMVNASGGTSLTDAEEITLAELQARFPGQSLERLASAQKEPMGAFLKSYLTCALWSSTDNADDSGGQPLDRNYSLSDLAPEALAKAQADCEAFQRDNAETLELASLSAERAGHCLWLNRNGHGSGFWDEYMDDSPEDKACQRLSDASEALGSADLYVGDNGQLYFA